MLDHIDFIDNDNVMLESFYVTAEAIVNTLSNQMSRITRLAKGKKPSLIQVVHLSLFGRDEMPNGFDERKIAPARS